MAFPVLALRLLSLFWLDKSLLYLLREGDLVGCNDIRRAASFNCPVGVQSGRDCSYWQGLWLAGEVTTSVFFSFLLMLALPWFFLLMSLFISISVLFIIPLKQLLLLSFV